MSDDVHPWLRALGLEQYSDAFVANDIDLRVLPHLTEADLRELGLSLGHRRILMAAVAGSFEITSPPQVSMLRAQGISLACIPPPRNDHQSDAS